MTIQQAYRQGQEWWVSKDKTYVYLRGVTFAELVNELIPVYGNQIGVTVRP